MLQPIAGWLYFTHTILLITVPQTYRRTPQVGHQADLITLSDSDLQKNHLHVWHPNILQMTECFQLLKRSIHKSVGELFSRSHIRSVSLFPHQTVSG